MSVRAHPSLLDRLLLPATGLMARLRFGQKAMLIGAAFVLACAVLAGIILVRATDQLDAARAQQAAIAGVNRLQRAMLAMQAHEQLTVRRFAKDEVADAELRKTAAAVDAELRALAAWQAQALPDPGLQKGVAAVREAWAQAAADHPDVLTAVTAHDQAIRRAGEAMGLLSNASGLGQAQNAAVLYIGRAASEWLPTLAEYTSQQGVVALRVLGDGAIWVDDRTGLAVSRNMQQYVRSRAELELHDAEREMASLKRSMGEPFRKALDALAKQNEAIQAHVLDAETPVLPVKTMAARVEAARQALGAAMAAANASLHTAAAAEIDRLQRRTVVTLGVCVLVLLLVAYLFLGFSRAMRAAMGEANRVARQIADGRLDNAIVIQGRDELADLLGSMRQMQAQLRDKLEEERRIADENLRVRTALDNVGSNVMIADNERRIVYLNNAIQRMLAEAEADMRQELPQFEAARVLGGNMDMFHKNPEHVRRLLESLREHYATRMRVGGRTFALSASPIIDRAGERLGSVVEWRDITAEVAVEAEIAEIVQAAVDGDFSRRIGVAGKQGFFLQLAEGINQLLESNASAMDDIVRVLSALAQGDLTQTIETEYRGTLAKMRDDMNATVAQLAQIVGQIREGSDAISAAAAEIAAGNGDLSQRTEQQAASLEETASSMEELTSTV
ncbi:methyl-accepting chemotaxis protein, partial [Vulcaniibacterium tengchongense]